MTRHRMTSVEDVAAVGRVAEVVDQESGALHGLGSFVARFADSAVAEADVPAPSIVVWGKPALGRRPLRDGRLESCTALHCSSRSGRYRRYLRN